MKLFNNMWWGILFLCSFYTHAKSELGVVDCTIKENVSCDVSLNIKRNVDDVSYRVELIDVKTEEKIFPYPEENETLESVSLQKYGVLYVFSKQYLDSTKAIEFITFKYDNKIPSSVIYYYIESSIDFNAGMKTWSGKKCETSAGKIIEKNDVSLLQAASELCGNRIKLTDSLNEYNGNDVIFHLLHIENGLKKNEIPVIGLDRKDTDAINLNDIGCLNNCDIDSYVVNYTGKLNERTRIGLHLEYNGDNVSGFYFYDKVKKKINVIGRREGDRLILSATVPEGMESFEGLLEGGQFKGIWSNAMKNKKYPFCFYLNLIQ